MIVKVSGVPTQLLAVGVTIMLETTVALVRFVATNDAIFPEPLAANPIEGALFVQVNVVPATGLVKLIAAVLTPLQ